MTAYQPYVNFTAHGTVVRSLMLLYAQLERRERENLPAELLPIVVFMAFSIEAYLNSLGSRSISFWDQIERSPWRQKVAILHKDSGNDAQWGQEPLQFATEIFQLRDRLAHGKSEQLLGPLLIEPGEAGLFLGEPILEPEWFKHISTEWALAAKLRFTTLMTYLGALYGHPESDHLHSASGGFIRHD